MVFLQTLLAALLAFPLIKKTDAKVNKSKQVNKSLHLEIMVVGEIPLHS